MPALPPLTLKKEERICSKLLIEKLFNGNQSRSLASYPLRVVYLKKERQAAEQPVQLLISVPKRNLRRAVDRNRVKRQIRDAYRRNKHLLTSALALHPDITLALAIIWLDSQIAETSLVEKKIKNILQRISETPI